MKKTLVIGFAFLLFAAVLITLRGPVTSYYFNKGIEYRQDGQYEKAIVSFSRSIWFSFGTKEAHEAYYNRGLTYHNLKRYRLAINDYSQAIKLCTSYAEDTSSRSCLRHYHNSLGVAHSCLNDYKTSIYSYNEAIELDPQFGLAYENRCIANFHLKEYQLAIDDCIKATDLESAPSDDLINTLGDISRKLGDSLFEARRYEDAIGSYTKLSKLNPRFISDELESKLGIAYFEVGLKYLKSNEYKTAIENFEKAYEFNPAYSYKLKISQTLIKLAQEKERGEEYQLAINYYEEALKYSSENQVHIKDAIIYLAKLQKCKEAGRELDRGDDYYSRIDWYLMEEVNGILKDLKENAYVSNYDIEKVARNFDDILEMTDCWRKAHQHYKEAMRLAREGNCQEIENRAFSSNARMMTSLLHTADEINEMILKLIRLFPESTP
jgi:tetratricopeptide (TPR) repeat protein